MSDVDVAFWVWFGKQAAKGEVEAGNEDLAEQLRQTFNAGWDEAMFANARQRHRHAK